MNTYQRRNRPKYIYTIVGVAVVQIIIGIMGWFYMDVVKISTIFKEEVRISAYLNTTTPDSIKYIQNYISSFSAVKKTEFISKDQAKEIWNKENNEDWSKVLDYNPLPESIDFYMRSSSFSKDSIMFIAHAIQQKFPTQIAAIVYPPILITNLKEASDKIGLIFILMSLILILISVVSIDNTIKLAVFSNRFLIKTMQLVGAKPFFIMQPIIYRSVINGIISSIISIIGLLFMFQSANFFFPPLRIVNSIPNQIIIFAVVFLLGLCLCLFSTIISVSKYLNSKIEELY
ncbi:MAG: permease-like cell division protein FtsX [Phycisphaerales bacterium]|nr:permease-like cell division protein FtsX [Phycisphaerales bacterium]